MQRQQLASSRRAAHACRPFSAARPGQHVACHAATHESATTCSIPAVSSSAASGPSTAQALARRQLLAVAASALAGSALLPGMVPPALAAPAPRTEPLGPEGNVTLLTQDEQDMLTLSERQVLLLNQRIQSQNRAPNDFPQFIREGFDVKVIAPGFKTSPDGIIYKDYTEGTGEMPQDGQEVVFQYTGYNESATSIDSSYRQGRPAQTQLGTGGLIPGFEMGLRTMKVGTQRRFIVPPALGPPVGPSTFFSAKQCEVFDVEILAIRTCKRTQTLMFSSVVCE